MTVLKQYVLRAAIFLILCMLLMYGLLFFLAPSARFKHFLESELTARTGLHFVLGEISFRAPFTLVLGNVTIVRGPDRLFSSARALLSLRPLDLLSRTIHRLSLERPVLYLNLQELMQPGSEVSAAVAVRHLIIEEGAVLFAGGTHDPLELSSIHLEAQNLNVGTAGALSLRAEVPYLGAEAQVTLKQQLWEKDIEVTLRSRPPGRRAAAAERDGPPPETLRLQAKLTTEPGSTPIATFAGSFAELQLGPRALTGELSGRAVANSDLSAADLSAHVEIADFPNSLSRTNMAVPAGVARVELAGNLSMVDKLLTLTTFRLESPVGRADGGGRFLADAKFAAEPAWLTLRQVPWEIVKNVLPAPLRDWSYGGTGNAELRFRGPWQALQIDGTVAGKAVQIKGDGLTIGGLDLHAPMTWKQSGLEFENTTLIAQSLSFSSATGWQTGAAQLEMGGSLAYNADQPLKMQASIQLSDGRFASPDSSKMAEGLSLAGRFDLSLNAPSDITRLAGKLAVGRGEMLWGRHFVDLGKHRPVLQLDGDYLRQRDSIALRHTELSLSSAGSLVVTGSIAELSQEPVLDLAARGDNLDVGQFFEELVRLTYRQTSPVLDDLVVGGRLGLQIRVGGAMNRMAATGRMTLQAGELRARSNGWQIGPLALTLPFDLHYPARSTTPAAGTSGILAIRGGRLAGRSIAPMAAPVSLINNALIFHQPLHLPIFGGSVEIANLAWPDIINDPKGFSLALEAKQLNLEDLTDALGWHRFSGTLSGSIPQIRSSGDMLRSEGRIEVDLFSGRLQISKMEIENFFSTLPILRLDARFQDIRLEQASETFAFGKISGILEGVVENLVITDRQPARFEADIRTVPRSGVSQWISVEALNQITVLSSGQDSAPLYGGLATLFDNFRYSRLGFRASLRNDKLILRGVESRDGKEFLVVGSLLPPTVNIISHTQEIGFSELLRRVARIQSEKHQPQ